MARELIKALDQSAPVGEIKAFSSDVVPVGYLLCDGRSISRSEYLSLFSTLGTQYGQGDGSTTFNLPDFRGLFLRGKVGVSTVAGSGSASSNNATFTNHGLNRTGFKVRLQSGTLTGLAASTDYYAIVVNSNTLAFATSKINALAGTKVAISGTNTAVLTQWEDPDAISRLPMNIGGNLAYGLGSTEDDALQNITGQVATTDNNTTSMYARVRAGFAGAFSAVNVTGNPIDSYSVPGTQTFPGIIDFDASRIARTSDETRPKNAYVNYIIKF